MEPGDDLIVRWDRRRDPPDVVDQRRTARVVLAAMERLGDRLRAVDIDRRPGRGRPVVLRGGCHRSIR
jgi:hypothetical protein